MTNGDTCGVRCTRLQNPEGILAQSKAGVELDELHATTSQMCDVRHIEATSADERVIDRKRQVGLTSSGQVDAHSTAGMQKSSARYPSGELLSNLTLLRRCDSSAQRTHATPQVIARDEWIARGRRVMERVRMSQR